MKTLRVLGIVAIIVGVFFATREFFPSHIVNYQPKLVPVYLNVEHVDTLWKTKLIKQEKWDTVFLERVVTARPETVSTSFNSSGVTQIKVPEKMGDSTVVLGETIARGDTGKVTRTRWEVSYWTPGPLKALSTDTFPPRISFYDPPKKGCNLGCKFKLVGVGALIGLGVTLLKH